jgi:hypothetical protein
MDLEHISSISAARSKVKPPEQAVSPTSLAQSSPTFSSWAKPMALASDATFGQIH